MFKYFIEHCIIILTYRLIEVLRIEKKANKYLDIFLDIISIRKHMPTLKNKHKS